MKHWLVTYRWKSRMAREWSFLNEGVEAKCIGTWWVKKLEKKGASETFIFINATPITKEGYWDLEEAEVGH